MHTVGAKFVDRFFFFDSLFRERTDSVNELKIAAIIQFLRSLFYVLYAFSDH